MKSLVLFLIVFLGPYKPSHATSTSGELNRLEKLLSKMPKGSPFRPRLLGRIKAIKEQENACPSIMDDETEIGSADKLDLLMSSLEVAQFPPMEFFSLLYPEVFPENFSLHRKADLDIIIPRLASHPEQAVETFMITPEEIGCRLWGCDAHGVDQLSRYQKSVPFKLGSYLRPRRIIFEQNVEGLENAIKPYLTSRDASVQLRALMLLSRLNLPFWQLLNQVMALADSSNDVLRARAHVVLFLTARTYGIPENIPTPIRKNLVHLLATLK